ncbi:MAG: AAA family ATPase [Candidatus Hodarchaeota archaeon]
MDLEIVNAKEFIESKPEEKEMAIKGLLERGSLGFLFGQPKIGKSLLAFNLALEASKGGIFLDTFPIPKPLRTLLLIGEGSRRSHWNRLRKIAGSKGIQNDNLKLLFNRRLKLDQRPDVNQLIAVIKEHHIDFLIVDPLFRYFIGDEKEGADMAKLINNIGLVQEKGVTVVIVHHVVKDTQGKSPGQRLRGHGSLHAAGETYIMIERLDGSRKTISIEFDYKDGEIESMKAKRNDDTLTFYAEGLNRAGIPDMVHILKENGGRMEQQQLISLSMNRFGIRSDKTVREILGHAKEIGVIDSRPLPGKGGPLELFITGGG